MRCPHVDGAVSSTTQAGLSALLRPIIIMIFSEPTEPEYVVTCKLNDIISRVGNECHAPGCMKRR